MERPEVIVVSGFAVAGYCAIEASRGRPGAEADRSTIGIVLALLSFRVRADRRAARETGSASAAIHSRQALLCSHPPEVRLPGSLPSGPPRMGAGGAPLAVAPSRVLSAYRAALLRLAGRALELAYSQAGRGHLLDGRDLRGDVGGRVGRRQPRFGRRR